MSLLIELQHKIDRLFHLLGEDLGHYAASLSFYTIFSFIPMLWVLFFVFSQFEAFDSYYLGIKSFLVVNLVPTHTEAVSEYLDSFLENSKKMGVWGIVYTLVVSILFYRNYQYVVNKIFFMPNNSFLHAVETYLILAVLMPITLGGSFILSDFIQRAVGEGFGVFTLLSYVMIWAMFFIIYKVSPNMRISIPVALLTSFLISGVWQIAKIAFVEYVFLNQTYTSLYGSFSILLFFLLWVYLSWFLLLQGLRMSYVIQCHRV